jgi:L-ascorbate metabolism protein UlaG (beta-lactamase superfamily)
LKVHSERFFVFKFTLKVTIFFSFSSEFMSTVSFTYLGHSAVLLNCDGVAVAIDPWLKGNPMCPEKFINPEKIDIVVLTHGHSDHASDAVRIGKQYGSVLITSFELGQALIDDGYPEESVYLANKGGTVVIDKVKVTLTHALHSNSYESANGVVYAGEACGCIVRHQKTVVYHAGDTDIFSDMALIKELHKPQVSFLPVGDRFTMGPTDACNAAMLLSDKNTLFVPIHHSTFPALTGTAKDFVKRCSNNYVHGMIAEIGKEYIIDEALLRNKNDEYDE